VLRLTDSRPSFLSTPLPLEEFIMSSIHQTSQSTFKQDVLQSPVPILIDFYADWCGPCRMLAPTLEQLSTEFAGRLQIVKVNVEAEPELAGRFQVTSIPTLAFVVGGKLVAQVEGMQSEPVLRRTLTRLMEATSHRQAS